MTFKKLQAEKVKLAGELLEKLVSMRSDLLEAEFAGKMHQAKSKLAIYATSLKHVATLIKNQKDICTDAQCEALLDQELDALAGRKGAITHIERVFNGGELVEAVIREPLMTIASREQALSRMALDTGHSPS